MSSSIPKLHSPPTKKRGSRLRVRFQRFSVDTTPGPLSRLGDLSEFRAVCGFQEVEQHVYLASTHEVPVGARLGKISSFERVGMVMINQLRCLSIYKANLLEKTYKMYYRVKGKLIGED